MWAYDFYINEYPYLDKLDLISEGVWKFCIVVGVFGFIGSILMLISFCGFLSYPKENRRGIIKAALYLPVFLNCYTAFSLCSIILIPKGGGLVISLILFPLEFLCELSIIVLLIIAFIKSKIEKRRMRAWETNNSLVG